MKYKFESERACIEIEQGSNGWLLNVKYKKFEGTASIRLPGNWALIRVMQFVISFDNGID